MIEPYMIFIAIAVVAVIGIASFILAHIKTVPPSEALLVSGAKNNGAIKVVPPGSRAFIIPIVQSVEGISLSQQTVDAELKDGLDLDKVPVTVEAVCIVKVGSEESMIRAAAERFSGSQDSNSEVQRNIKEILVGTLRTIVSRMKVEDLIAQREALQAEVQDNVSGDLRTMGITLESFQIREIRDENGYIESLGVPQSEAVKRNARIARAENEKQAADAEIASRQAIAEKNRDYAIRQAELKAEIDKAEAEAQAAGPLAKAAQDREIAKIEQEAAAARAELRERELESEVIKPADAEKYRRQQEAEATKIEANLAADAENYRRQKEAEVIEIEARAQASAVKQKALADADATRARGEAEAAATEARGKAEAEAVKAAGLAEAAAMEKRAEAYRMYNDAAVLESVLAVIPATAEKLAESYNNVGELKIISTDGATALSKSVVNNYAQVQEMIESATGINLNALVEGFMSKNKAVSEVPAIETSSE